MLRPYTTDADPDTSRTPPREPPAREPRPAQPARDVRVGTEQLPHEPRAVVLGHREHRSFIDAEVVGVEPAEPRVDAPLGCLSGGREGRDRKSTRLNSSHSQISYAVFCLKKKK